MSAGSRSTPDQDQAARVVALDGRTTMNMDAFAAAFRARRAARDDARGQDEGKAVIPCSGPTGPCVHPEGIGHAGDHVRPERAGAHLLWPADAVRSGCR